MVGFFSSLRKKKKITKTSNVFVFISPIKKERELNSDLIYVRRELYNIEISQSKDYGGCMR